MVDKKLEDQIVQFVAVTGASTRDAKKFLEHFGRLDVAIDSYFNDPKALSGASSRNRGGAISAPSTSKLGSLFDKYKDPSSDEITIDGTIQLCEDLEVDPEDVVMLAVAYELKSPKVGEWTKSGWLEGWKNLGVDSIAAMKPVVQRLRSQLSSDPAYFKKVYYHTFDFARNEGQRSLGLDTAQAFWTLLLPHGLEGGALSHHREDDDQDDRMTGTGDGFKREYVDWWFEFLNEKGGKGVSKDTWQMLFDFIRTIDSQFSNYDEEAAWPSAFDEFVEYAKKRLQS